MGLRHPVTLTRVPFVVIMISLIIILVRTHTQVPRTHSLVILIVHLLTCALSLGRMLSVVVVTLIVSL